MEASEDFVLFLEKDMQDVQALTFGAGQAVVFSARAPGKESPNEDAAALIPFDQKSGVILVADGAGGLRGGAQASSTIVHEMCATLELAAANSGPLRDAILNGIESANVEITTLGIGAASTLALVELREGRLRPYHVGDSEILVVGQRGKVKLQTISHSPTGYAVESGLLGEREAMQHEDRHFVSNVIGSAEMRIEVGPEIELSSRDTVLVACDGLFDNLSWDEISETLRTGDLVQATRELVQRCRRRMERTGENPGKPDDLTLVAFRLSGDSE